jgi:hypothetical protein
MTEMQAAIGRTALPKVPGWVDIRRAHAAVLDECVAGLPGLRVTRPSAWERHAYYKYYAFVRPDALADGWSRSRIAEAVRAEGVPCFTGSCPEIYLERAFDGMRPPERLPVARELGETSLMFLVHPTLVAEDVAGTCEALRKVMEVAAR